MPQSNAQVHEYNLKDDMRSYYRGSVATLSVDGVRLAAYVEDFTGDNQSLYVKVRTLPLLSGGWRAPVSVPLDSVEFTLPSLGLIKMGEFWFHLSRQPARRMRKGYHPETIQAGMLDDKHYEHGCDVMSVEVIRQVWYGNPDRIATNIVVWGNDIYYATEKVASLDNEGNVGLILNKEKLGEFACKALANNWDTATSKHSVRTLPSSQPTPLV